jgi:hypothetical protein
VNGPLPGWALDLATDGVRLTDGRVEVVKAVRCVMLSAHHAGWAYSDIYALLTDTGRRSLARQLAHGGQGRPLSPARRNAWLRRTWLDLEGVYKAHRPYSRDEVLDAIEKVAADLERAELDADKAAVLAVVIDLARGYATARVAVPVHVVVERTGLSKSKSHRLLMRLCDEGDWIKLAKRGDRLRGRSNLYRVVAVDAYLGLTAYVPPPSYVPRSYVPRQDADPMTVTLTISRADPVELRRALVDMFGISSGDVRFEPVDEPYKVVPRRVLNDE